MRRNRTQTYNEERFERHRSCPNSCSCPYHSYPAKGKAVLSAYQDSPQRIAEKTDFPYIFLEYLDAGAEKLTKTQLR